MINASEAYREAIFADSRRVRVKAVVRIVDPDISFGTLDGEMAPYSRPEQLHDEITELSPNILTLEKNRWILGKDCVAYDDLPDDAEVSVVGKTACGGDGYFANPVIYTQPLAGVDVLQGLSVLFSESPWDGVPRDLTIELLGGEVEYAREITDNTETVVPVRGFTVRHPTALRLTFTRWSLPYRVVRIPEIIVGLYEYWTGDDLSEVDIKQQGNFTGLTLPYGTCRLTMDNQDRRFEPRNKEGIFASLEERQGVEVSLGIDTDVEIQYIPLGMYYQANDGWKTGENLPTMTWALVDIIGLLQDRTFAPAATLPTTLEGWVRALCGQLGSNFEERYTVDPDYADLPCTVNHVSELNGITCGKILIWICQATGTFARADAETGYLAVEPYWSQGVMLDLDNLESYPTMSANNDIALVTITTSDGKQYAWNGTSLAASNTQNVNNPFLHTYEQARKVAEQIITAHGGNQIETIGRGDFTSEIGDVATIQLDKSNATTARVMQQTFRFQGGLLRGCQTKMLQATGGKLYDESVLIKESGTWTCPHGVSYIRLAIGQGGQGGGKGYAGTVRGSGNIPGQGVSASNGAQGDPGIGGMIWFATVPVVVGRAYEIHIGAGGAKNGGLGGHTTFGPYSSVNGEIYPNGYTDILNGDSYGRTGVEAPLDGSSDGGTGGEGGEAGEGYWEPVYGPDGQPWGYNLVITKKPTAGKDGVPGASGFCLIQYVRTGDG